jgi:hypothetical protein
MVMIVMIPVGLDTKNHCAAEGQQQFSSQSVITGLKIQEQLATEFVNYSS